MRLQEFKIHIEYAESTIVERQEGVCVGIEDQFGSSLTALFNGLYRLESLRPERSYWIGEFNQKNTILRLEYLEHFKNFLIETKMYKEL